MPHLQKSASLRQFPFCTFAGSQLGGGRENSLGVSRGTQEIGGFLKRFVVFEREHHHGLLATPKIVEQTDSTAPIIPRVAA